MKSVARAPKVSTWDFRFLSAFVQGIDVKEAWDRYMGHRGSNDLRHIRSTVRTMLDVLAAAAKRHGDAATANLLRRDPLRIKASAVMNASSAEGVTLSSPAVSSSHLAVKSNAPPTLEAFREEFDDPDFFSEAELIDLWEERYGMAGAPTAEPGVGSVARPRDNPESRARKRRGRLVKRQLDALRRLESLVAAPPFPADPLAAWLDIEHFRRLSAVGINTVGELVAYLNAHGFRWYRKVPRVGEEGARRLVAWLQHHEGSVGGLDPFALKPVDQLDIAALTPRPMADLVPLERLVVPQALSGFDGENRKPLARCRIKALNDYQAVVAWLDMYRPRTAADAAAGGTKPLLLSRGADVPSAKAEIVSGNRHTWSAYRKEAERFLLWAVFERGKALSSLDSIDCAAYLHFLQAPGARWIAGKGMQRWSQDWRPFEGPLGPRSLRYAETVCKMMCKWLASQNYLDTNPWDGAPKGSKKTPLRVLRALTQAQSETLNDWLAGLPRTPANVRLRVLFELGLNAGLRKEEIANAESSWLRQDPDASGHAGWWLQFYGKGGKERKVPLDEISVEALIDAMEFKGLAVRDARGDIDLELFGASIPLLSRLDNPFTPLPPARIYNLVKDGLAKCAQTIEDANPRMARQLVAASTHWLRHTFGSEWAKTGGDLRVLGSILGHTNPATTAIYTQAEDKLMRSELEMVSRRRRTGV